MQPVTISRWQAPSVLCRAISRIASIDSCLAESMNAQVLTIRTSALGGVLRELVPALLREPEHHLGVDQVLRAAEGDHSDFHANLN